MNSNHRLILAASGVVSNSLQQMARDLLVVWFSSDVSGCCGFCNGGTKPETDGQTPRNGEQKHTKTNAAHTLCTSCISILLPFDQNPARSRFHDACAVALDRSLVWNKSLAVVVCIEKMHRNAFSLCLNSTRPELNSQIQELIASATGQIPSFPESATWF